MAKIPQQFACYIRLLRIVRGSQPGKICGEHMEILIAGYCVFLFDVLVIFLIVERTFVKRAHNN